MQRPLSAPSTLTRLTSPAATRDGRYVIGDPALGIVECSEAEVSGAWLAAADDDGVLRGVVLGLSPTDDFKSGDECESQGIGLRKSLPSLWAYVRPHRWCIVQLAAGLAFGCLVQLILPFLSQAVVDVGVGLRDISALWAVVIAQMALMLGRAAAGFIRSWILLRIGAIVAVSLPVGLFAASHQGGRLDRALFRTAKG